MFGRKKAQELQQSQAGQEEKLSAAIKEASAIADPAKKVVALQAVRDQIDLSLAAEESKLTEKVGKSKRKADAVEGVGDLAAVGGFITGCVMAGPIGWAVMGGGMALSWGAKAAGKQRRNSIKKKNENETGLHKVNLKELQAEVDDAIDETLVNNIEAIVEDKTTFLVKLASNPDFLSRVKKIPGLSQRYNAVSLKLGEQAKKDIADYLARAEARKKAAAAAAATEEQGSVKKTIKKIIKP